MNEVIILVEGRTEKAVLGTKVVRCFFEQRGIQITISILSHTDRSGQSRAHGGNDYKKVRKKLGELLRRSRESLVSMCFDYYGLKGNWPGYKESLELPYESKAACVCEAITKDLGNVLLPSELDRFLPYVQMHEIECVLFSDPLAAARVIGDEGAAKQLEKVAGKFLDLERINNKPGMNPADRFRNAFPNYIKGGGVNSHAARIVEEIGVDVIHEGCPQLRCWFDDMASIASPSTH